MQPMRTRMVWGLLAFWLGSSYGLGNKPRAAETEPAGAAARAGQPNASSSWPEYGLKADQIWRLNLHNGQRFDASGLALTPQGELLTISDRGAAIYQVKFLQNTNAADLIQVPNCFTTTQLAPFAREKIDRYDCEGLCLDEEGHIYICE